MDKNAKDLWGCFDVDKIGVSKAKEIILEMTKWDGFIDKSKRYCFSTTNKKQLEFYSLISTIAGYSHSFQTQTYNKNNWKDMYNLQIYTNQNRNFKQSKTQYEHYKGLVHCVDVGGKLVVFRKDGKSFVAYNCVGCPYSHTGKVKELIPSIKVATASQIKYAIDSFGESYKVKGIYEEIIEIYEEKLRTGLFKDRVV